MNETTEWLLNEAKRHADEAKNFQDEAFYLALQDFIQRQAERLTSLQGEIDGRSWNHEQW